MLPSMRQLLLLTGGCLVLGAGVGVLLVADLGSDGYSTFVNGLALHTGTPFWIVNLVVGVVLVLLAAARRVPPGVGTVVQVVLVGATVSVVLEVLSTPSGVLPRSLLLITSLPLLAVGVSLYLGSGTGAGPAEAAALAWDPPVPFRWGYTSVQGGGALLGWLLGATIGPGTVAVVVLLGPAVEVVSRWWRLDVHQGASARC